jgi:Glycosyl transferases group 1
MRFFYADPALRDNVGHHANTCRVVTGELRRRGIETAVLAFSQVEPALQQELGALPYFRFLTYWLKNDDPIGGWLTVFHMGAQLTCEDLQRLPPMTNEDVLYLNSAQPAQLMGLVSFLRQLPPERRPRSVVEFGTVAGVDVVQTGNGFDFVPLDPRDDARAVLFRYIGKDIPQDVAERLYLTTFDGVASQAFEFLIGHRVGVLPLPQQASGPIRNRVGKRPLTVGVLGHQRPDKGYQHIPDVLRRLLARHADLQILVHNAAPSQMQDLQNEVRALAQGGEWRVIVDERVADPALWQYLLAGTDILLCPYDPSRFVTSYSAITVEAVANGIPIVVPAATSMSRFVEENGGAGIAFGSFTPEAIADATTVAVANFDRLAELAHTAAETWNRQDRRQLLVDTILG